MNPFRPRLNANHHHHRARLNLDRLPGDMDRHVERSADGSVDRRLRLTQMPAIRLRLDRRQDVERFMMNMRILLQRQRANFNLGAGDGVYVWNWHEPPMATGLMGEGDGEGYFLYGGS